MILVTIPNNYIITEELENDEDFGFIQITIDYLLPQKNS